MIKAIHTSRQAIRDFNKKSLEFADIQARMQRQIDKKAMPAEPIEPGLDHHLVSQGLPAHFSVKQAMAKSMGIHNYTGTKEQDNLIMAGVQGKAATESANKQSETEQANKEREFALKERELEMKAGPSSDDIAASLLNKFNQ